MFIRRLFFCLVYVSVFVQGVYSFSDEAVINKIITELESVGSEIENIKIRFESWEEASGARRDSWERTDVYFSGVAWFDGVRGSRSRINAEKKIVPWADGDAFFSEAVSDYGFDGRQGRIASHASGPKGSPKPDGVGDILPDIPPALSSAWYGDMVGVNLFTSMHLDQEGLTIAEQLAGLLKHDRILDVDDVASADGGVIAVTAGIVGEYEIRYRFDGDKQYMMVGQERAIFREDGHREVLYDLVVTGAVETATGFWVPVSGYVETVGRNGPGQFVRKVFLGNEIEVNDPDFNDSIFTVSFPPGYRIRDRIKNIQYVAGVSPEELAGQLDEIVEDALNGRFIDGNGLRDKASTPEAEALRRTPSEVIPDQDVRLQVLIFFLVAGVSLVLIVSMLMVMLWKFKKRTSLSQ